MRIAPFALILSSVVLGGCGTVPTIQTTDSGTDTDTGTGTGTDSTTSDNPTTSGASASASASGGGACVPGMSVACTCTSGDPGAQTCNQSGSGFGPCECEGGESNSDSDSTTNPGTSTTTTTTDTGTTTDPGTSTEPDTTTGTSDSSTSSTTDPDMTTGGVMCDDAGPEPNEVEADAIDLGGQSCSDQGESFSGQLAGDADVDWFQYHAIDQGCGFVGDPTASHQITASEDVRLCVFVDCDNGNPAFQCEGGASNNDSPEGLPGCCNVGGNVTFDLNCMGGQESAQLFVRVDQAPADTCVDYEIAYEYD